MGDVAMSEGFPLSKRLGLMADAMVSAVVGPKARFFSRERVDEVVLLLREAEKALIDVGARERAQRVADSAVFPRSERRTDAAASRESVSGKLAADAPRSTPAPPRWQIACPLRQPFTGHPDPCSWCDGVGFVSIYLAKDIERGSEGDVPAPPEDTQESGVDEQAGKLKYRYPTAAVPPGAADAREPQRVDLSNTDFALACQNITRAFAHLRDDQLCGIWPDGSALRGDHIKHLFGDLKDEAIKALRVAPAAPRADKEINGLDSVHLSTTPTVLYPSDELRALAAELRACCEHGIAPNKTALRVIADRLALLAGKERP